MSDEPLQVTTPERDDEPVVVKFREAEVETTVTFTTGVKGPDTYFEGSKRRWALRQAIMAAEAFVRAAEVELARAP